MISITEELLRLRGREELNMEPSADWIVPIVVLCSEDGKQVLSSVTTLLSAVLVGVLGHPSTEEMISTPFEIDLGYWRSVLPNWFLDQTPTEPSLRLSGGKTDIANK